MQIKVKISLLKGKLVYLFLVLWIYMSVNTAVKINKHHLIQQYKMQNKHLLNMVQKTKNKVQVSNCSST